MIIVQVYIHFKAELHFSFLIAVFRLLILEKKFYLRLYTSAMFSASF